MSDGREQRVMDARDKFLLAAESINEDSTILADAILMAASEVLITHLEDRHLISVLFQNAADSLERDDRGELL